MEHQEEERREKRFKEITENAKTIHPGSSCKTNTKTTIYFSKNEEIQIPENTETTSLTTDTITKGVNN